jgi:hypothetical protein
VAAVSPIPETDQRPDWPRLVARKVNGLESRVLQLSGGVSGSGSFSLDDGTATASGVFSFDEGGA